MESSNSPEAHGNTAERVVRFSESTTVGTNNLALSNTNAMEQEQLQGVASQYDKPQTVNMTEPSNLVTTTTNALLVQPIVDQSPRPLAVFSQTRITYMQEGNAVAIRTEMQTEIIGATGLPVISTNPTKTELARSAQTNNALSVTNEDPQVNQSVQGNSEIKEQETKVDRLPSAVTSGREQPDITVTASVQQLSNSKGFAYDCCNCNNCLDVVTPVLVDQIVIDATADSTDTDPIAVNEPEPTCDKITAQIEPSPEIQVAVGESKGQVGPHELVPEATGSVSSTSSRPYVILTRTESVTLLVCPSADSPSTQECTPVAHGANAMYMNAPSSSLVVDSVKSNASESQPIATDPGSDVPTSKTTIGNQATMPNERSDPPASTSVGIMYCGQCCCTEMGTDPSSSPGLPGQAQASENNMESNQAPEPTRTAIQSNAAVNSPLGCNVYSVTVVYDSPCPDPGPLEKGPMPAEKPQSDPVPPILPSGCGTAANTPAQQLSTQPSSPATNSEAVKPTTAEVTIPAEPSSEVPPYVVPSASSVPSSTCGPCSAIFMPDNTQAPAKSSPAVSPESKHVRVISVAQSVIPAPSELELPQVPKVEGKSQAPEYALPQSLEYKSHPALAFPLPSHVRCNEPSDRVPQPGSEVRASDLPAVKAVDTISLLHQKDNNDHVQSELRWPASVSHHADIEVEVPATGTGCSGSGNDNANAPVMNATTSVKSLVKPDNLVIQDSKTSIGGNSFSKDGGSSNVAPCICKRRKRRIKLVYKLRKTLQNTLKLSVKATCESPPSLSKSDQ